MKNIFACANKYIQHRDWKMLALVKFCLCATGLIWGLLVPEKYRRVAFSSAIALFIATYIPLMADFTGFVKKYYTTEN